MRLLISFLLSTIVAHAAPVHLRTNALTTPLGIDTPRPILSWRTENTRPNWMQSSYEILVATTPARLKPGAADAWDSGKVTSSESVNIAYAGTPLKPQQRYLWSVRTWDNQGIVSTSAPTWFETGLMTPESWKAAWIAHKDALADREMQDVRWLWLPKTDAFHVPSATPAHFQYRLHLDAKPTAASLHILARGKFTAHVNGKETGHHDEWGAFDREEIAPYLHAGDNEIIIDVVSHRTGKDTPDAPSAVAASIHLTTADGKEERLVSDQHWQARATPDASWQSAQVVGPLSLAFGLGTDRQGSIPGPDRVATDASLLRKDFTIGTAIRTARLTITALGAYEAYLDGKRVSPGTLLTPGWDRLPQTSSIPDLRRNAPPQEWCQHPCNSSWRRLV